MRRHRERTLPPRYSHSGGIRGHDRRRYHHGRRLLRGRVSRRGEGLRAHRCGETPRARAHGARGRAHVQVVGTRAATARPRHGDDVAPRSRGISGRSGPSAQHARNCAGTRRDREQNSQGILAMGMATQQRRARSTRVEPHVDTRHAHRGGHRRGVATIPTDGQGSYVYKRRRQRSRGRPRRPLSQARRSRGRGRPGVGTRGAHLRQAPGSTRGRTTQALLGRGRRLAHHCGPWGTLRTRRPYRRRPQGRREAHPGGSPGIPNAPATIPSRRERMGTDAPPQQTRTATGGTRGRSPRRRARCNRWHRLPPRVQRRHHEMGTAPKSPSTGNPGPAPRRA